MMSTDQFRIIQEIPRGIAHALPFAPCRDPENVTPEEAFLPGEPIDLMNAGKFHHVPYITGFNSAESLFNILEDFLDPNVFNVYNANPNIMIPRSWNVPSNSSESESITQGISEFYFNGRQLSRDVRYQYTQVKDKSRRSYCWKILTIFFSIFSTTPT